MERYGLLIDYEYCTGCQACNVACAQEHNWPPGVSGMKVFEHVQEVPGKEPYLMYMPYPTELCILCRPRTKKGLEPACVKHCMANVLTWGTLERLVGLVNKPKMAIFLPT
ncbi:MAG: oxidoreductase [Desulfatiglandales bacterium]